MPRKKSTPQKNEPEPEQPRSRSRGCALLLCLVAVASGAWWVWQQLQDGSSYRGSLPEGTRIGIVAGHAGSDAGAICPDGLTEAEVNLDIAEGTVDRLRQAGAEVDLLNEFDDRLYGYQAAAFVSIHADSCEVDRSGFKVARVGNSAVPEIEDRLVSCLWQEYEKATNLEPDPSTITHDMVYYHAFNEIHTQTPGAIIEVGYLSGDRFLLTGRSDRAARGIAEGILCFLAPASSAH